MVKVGSGSARLSAVAARRIAISATGLAAALPGERGRSGPAAIERVFGRLGLLQLDSVNVFERSHYLPLFSRLGPYNRETLDRMLNHVTRSRLTAGGSYTEYWAHEAAVIKRADWPLWQWRRARPLSSSTELWAAENAGLIAEIRQEFADRGMLAASELEHESNTVTGGGWWNKSDAYWASHMLFRRGEIVTVGRTRFERVYASAESVLPDQQRESLPKAEAQIELMRRAAQALGVASHKDLADYYRLSLSDAREAIAALVAGGELETVEVEGWREPALLDPAARRPRIVRATALLSPFDPLVWFRPRLERLFGFPYRISIYTPKAERRHGYYVLPVLVDDEMVGRIDLKSDRAAGVLRVQHANIEPRFDARRGELAERVAPAIAEAAHWQNLPEVLVAGEGDWAGELARAMKVRKDHGVP